MMKICVILLVITSVVAAGGIFSPHEGKKKNPKNDDLIVKESHRLIVVEYERETTEFRNPNHHHHHHHHPQQQLHHESASRSQHHHHRKEEDKEDKPLEHGLSAASSMLGRSNERLKDSMPDLRQGSRKRRSESLSSDAYQKSKDRVLYKTPDVREAIDEVERAEETSHQAKEKVMNKAHDAKEEVMDKTHDTNEAVEGSDAKRIPEAVHHVKDNVLGKTHDMKKDAVEDSDGLNQDKGKVSEKPHNVNEALGDSGETAAGYIKGMPEILNQAREKVSDKVHSVKEAFEDARDTLSESVKETASNVKEKAKEKIAVKSHVLKQSAEELILPDEKEKASQDSEGLIKMAQEIIINRVHGIKEGAGNIKESLNEFFVEDLKEKVRMTKSAITDKRSAHQKITMLFKEGSRNFTNVFQSGWEMAVSDANIKWGLGVIRLVGYGTAYGSSVWVSFVFSHLLARVLPRQQFAAARSKIYPAYFRLIGYSIGSSMVAQILRRRYESAQTKYKKGEKIHAYDLHMALVFVLVNLLFLEPRATKMMAEKMKWGREEGRGIHGPSETQVTSRTRTAVSEDVTEEIVTERSHEEKVEKRVRERANNELGELNHRLEKMKWGREEGRGIHGPSETQVTSRTRTTVSEDVTEEIVTERSHEEKVEKRVRERANNELGELNQRLEKLNKYSAFFNILTIMTLTWHITFLAQCLYVSC